MRLYHIAIVGSGPSGFFAAASLLKAADAAEDFDIYVDMLEMLPPLSSAASPNSDARTAWAR